jgi:protein-disulfide isomerase
MIKALPLIALATASLLTACNKPAEAPKPEAPAATTSTPAGTNWVETVSETSDHGMLMGNPDAPVKLIEYGALSCPHCATFSRESREKLKNYIASGKVSYEFRTFLIHPQDVPASLLARCNGAGPFFPISEQMFDAQNDWLAKSSTITQEEQAAWGSMTPNQVATAMADKLGLVDFVRQRGIGADKAKACLADPAGVKALENISKVATDQFQISSTPSFIINGQLLKDTNSWDVLEPQLKAAGA